MKALFLKDEEINMAKIIFAWFKETHVNKFAEYNPEHEQQLREIVNNICDKINSVGDA